MGFLHFASSTNWINAISILGFVLAILVVTAPSVTWNWKFLLPEYTPEQVEDIMKRIRGCLTSICLFLLVEYIFFFAVKLLMQALRFVGTGTTVLHGALSIGSNNNWGWGFFLSTNVVIGSYLWIRRYFALRRLRKWVTDSQEFANMTTAFSKIKDSKNKE